MAFNVTLDLPHDIEAQLRRETADINADVKEAYALELFRRGKLSHFQLSQLLGLDRIETDAFLKQHGVFDGSLTMAELDADRAALERVVTKSR